MPVGAVVGRLAAKNARGICSKVFYTAHGFHFYNGASKLRWILFYPVEKWLSKYTDVLITINKEDHDLAKNKFTSKTIKRVNGVGVDLNLFSPIDEELKKVKS